MSKNIGPVQLLAVGFDPDARFEGRIIDELESLERHETIRILDRISGLGLRLVSVNSLTDEPQASEFVGKVHANDDDQAP